MGSDFHEAQALARVHQALDQRYPNLQVTHVKKNGRAFLHLWRPDELDNCEQNNFLPLFHIVITLVKDGGGGGDDPQVVETTGSSNFQLQLFTHHGKLLRQETVKTAQRFEADQIQIIDVMNQGRLQCCQGVQDLKREALELFFKTMKHEPVMDRVRKLLFIEPGPSDDAIVRSRNCKFLVIGRSSMQTTQATDFVRCKECDAFSHKRRSLTYYSFLKQFQSLDCADLDALSKNIKKPRMKSKDAKSFHMDHVRFERMLKEVGQRETKMAKCLDTFQTMSQLGMLSSEGLIDDKNFVTLVLESGDLNPVADIAGTEAAHHDATLEDGILHVEHMQEGDDCVPSTNKDSVPVEDVSMEESMEQRETSELEHHVKVEIKEELSENCVYEVHQEGDVVSLIPMVEGLKKEEGNLVKAKKQSKKQPTKKQEGLKKTRNIKKMKEPKKKYYYPKTYRKPCPVCLHHYSAPSLIANCIARHEEELNMNGSVKCPLCQAEIESKQLVTHHFATQHADTGKTCCCECLLVLPNENNRLRRHFIKVHHTAGKPEVCTKCGKSLPNARELKLHMEDHENNGMVCPYCGIGFQSRKNMVHHISRHHRTRDLKCPYCEKVFQNRCQARKHLALHTGLKPFKCPECKYSAYQATNVHTHVHKSHGMKVGMEGIIIDEEENEKMNQMIKTDADKMFKSKAMAENQQVHHTHFFIKEGP